jgi:RNA polymerase sigma-54 factor
MVLLQHKLSVKLSQRQILTPGLVQMVSVLALNKLELRDMITAEMVENPALEELEDSVPTVDEVARQEEERDRSAAAEEAPVTADDKKDSFEEIDFGSFFQDYLDPGYRTHSEMEEIERPSFENFLSKPTTLTDHLTWQLGALSLRPEVREAAIEVIGNLNEDGYLIATDEELLGTAPPSTPETDEESARRIAQEVAALGLAADEALAEESERESSAMLDDSAADLLPASDVAGHGLEVAPEESELAAAADLPDFPVVDPKIVDASVEVVANGAGASVSEPGATAAFTRPQAKFSLEDLHEALEVVRQMDPPGIACRDLRGCLLYQLHFHQRHLEQQQNGNGTMQVLSDAIAIVGEHLRGLQNKQYKEIARAIGRPAEAVQSAFDYIRTLDPRPGLQYNKVQPRLIEPDVAFVKHGDEWLVIMNDDDLPTLRLNPAYKRLLTRDGNEKSTRDYVKERYKSAIQLIKNIEQRKQTITKVCYSIVMRQGEFLELGIDQLKPMMIKEVAEEIGVHPSTVSRAVANKYVHTPQGVFELRYFFSESVQGPEGGSTSLLILKRRVKKLIEDEDPARPLTDDQITRILQSQGIQVTRRTVAKYREDMRIPSTHQRRVKK